MTAEIQTRKARSLHLRAGLSMGPLQPSITVTLFILTGEIGRSPAPVFVVSIFFTTSMPSMTLPNTGCFEAPGVNQSRYELWTVLMKNWHEPLLGRPVFAIDSVPGSFERRAV